jgi:hypothetical protein
MWSCFRISVAVVARPYATEAVTTVSALQLLINSRGNPTIELLLKFSASNSIWYWTVSFQVLITTPPVGYVKAPASSAVSLKLLMKNWIQVALLLPFGWKVIKTESIFIAFCFAVYYMSPASLNSFPFTKSYPRTCALLKHAQF